MRAGGCTVEQALTAEAANVVKQAMGLARRRGHAQVTPLHVASTMLSAPTGLLRTACLQSHTHPLQCRALELCFNVALNRLPTSTGSPMLGVPTSPFPSISNALGAAFKRAQAHQRRGSIESQQQPILAVKIEVEQLIISILDDPSVSRVMREAGFSSPQVKSKVEQAVSLEICSKTTSSSKPKEGKLLTPVRNEDVMNVINNLVDKKRRNFVIVGECLATVDGVVKTVMEKVDKKDVPEALKDVKFITLSFSSFGQPSRADVEHKLEELETLVKSCVGKGVILNLGDLNWFVESRTRGSSLYNNNDNYCVVEHMIMEIGKLARGLVMGDHGRFWLMGLATSQTYLRCKSGQPSLESLWCLTTLTIPATSNSLRLSLVSESELEVKKSGNVSLQQSDQFSFCEECSVKFESEARFLKCSNSNVTNATLPAWLQQYKKESQNSHTDSDSIKELVVKWNSICDSIHKRPSLKTLTLSSPTSSFPGSIQPSSTMHHLQTNGDWPVIETNTHRHHSVVPETSHLRLFIPEHDSEHKTELLFSNPNSTMNSAASSSDAMEVEHATSRFKEMNAENLATLCDALESTVPWQKDLVPELAKTVLKCRSGSSTRKINGNDDIKEDTWMFFQGLDVEAKEKIARELAKLVFGSQDSFVSICLSSFSSTRSDSAEDLRNKRSRDEQSWSYIERFSEAVSLDPNRVFLVEDIEQADYLSQVGFKRAIERGRVCNSSGEEASLRNAIVILSCERFSSRSRACSPPVNQKSDGSDKSEDKNVATCVALDLNLSIEDDVCEEESCDEIGLLEAVDARFHFKCSST
ncbi:Clp N-terminal domain superfamily [Arabidopsis suecica]|uniref:Clp N-terminal domain superfamily n=1 Tax=Arabidopsis suecica TaxID=45249 RepID=A0A8T1ZYW7_ARASU|nr:Clp N-terminal domain superfamily [Arabidopsis suecica]